MEYLTTIINAAGAVCIAVGVMMLFGGINEMTEARQQGRPSNNGEWWKLAQGALWVALGASTFLLQVFQAIKFD